MKLLLTSNGLTNEAIKRELERLLGKPFSESRCVLVPTAIHAERGDKRWKLAQSSELMAMGWDQLEIMDVSVATTEECIRLVTDSDLVVFGGGNPNFLHTKIIEKFTNQEFRDLMQDKVWLSSSAGSMILSPKIYIDRGWEFYGEQPPELSNEGLGWVDFCTLPHYDASTFASELCQNAGIPTYALGDGNALSLEQLDATPRVIEESRWELFGANQGTRQIILIGGASTVGKTTLAKKLGRELNLPWFSTDFIHDMTLAGHGLTEASEIVRIRQTSAEEFYATNTIDEVVASEIAISHETLPGIQALIDSGFVGIIEGVAILPELVSQLETDATVTAFFLTNEDRPAILQVAREQGIWDLPHLYSDETKHKEVDFVVAYNTHITQEAERLGYPTITATRTEQDLEQARALLA